MVDRIIRRNWLILPFLIFCIPTWIYSYTSNRGFNNNICHLECCIVPLVSCKLWSYHVATVHRLTFFPLEHDYVCAVPYFNRFIVHFRHRQFIWDFSLSKLYTNALLSALNARDGWSEIGTSPIQRNSLSHGTRSTNSQETVCIDLRLLCHSPMFFLDPPTRFVWQV